MYCIYSGKEFDTENLNVEHIIPISLGGCDQFTIQVYLSIENQVKRSLKTRSLLTKFCTCGFAATGAEVT